MQKDLGGIKEHIQFFDSGWSDSLHGKCLEAVKETSLFFCTTTPAFKLQNAISGCTGTNVFLWVPVIYNVFKIPPESTVFKQPEKLLGSVKQSVTKRLLHKIKI